VIARVTTFTIDGVDSRRVWVEADIRLGLPAFTVVGLADKAVREARERVRAAIVNSGYEFPQKRITVNLAPAYLRKIGPGFDLPLAVAVIVAAGQLEPDTVDDCALVGELSLTGEVRAVRGALAIAEGTRRHLICRLVLPRSRACEAALVPGVTVLGIETLQQAVDLLAGRTRTTSQSRCRSRSSTWPRSAVRTRSFRRSRWPPPAATTCTCTGRPVPARRCSPAASRRSCRR
jgi:magnesium chelatase family protein